ncbi:MAG: formylglycine-generating enzyme family protein, partial [Trichodesmium sp. St16_bin2-tuft]|nr:formylglycine-generating enzyme family protein [Trichodesmium sp. St16_bin2-tuft]
MPEKQRDNYFILLGIDPKESWSDEKFEQTLIQKRAEWSAKSKLPGRKGAQYQEYLALVSEIQKIMRDPGQRAKEAEMAKTSQQETPGKVEQEKLITEIDIISSKGFIYESEIQGLVRKYQKFVPESFIRNEINRNNIQINQDVDEPNLETLDETQLKRIKGYLETLGYQNIYEFLELSKTTAKNKIFIDRAQEKYEKSQKSGRKDTKTEAQRGLAIESKNIFATEKTRRLYDNSLELEEYKIIKDNIQSLAQISSDKILYPKQFDKILKIAQSSGIENVEKAKKVIIKYAREKNLSLEFLDMNNDLSTAIANYSRETESVRQKQTPPPRPKIPIQIFTTVRVNSRGDIIIRSEGKAEVMTEDIGNGVSLEMVKIPGGIFLMGSPETEAERQDREGPQHYVNVPEFFMGKYTVTQAQWQAVMGNNPSYFKGKNCPV